MTNTNTISLAELLSAHTKDELQEIRRFLDIRKASQLNKSDLVQSIYTFMLDHLGEHLERMDHNRFNVLKKVMNVPNAILPMSRLMDDEHYEPVYYQLYGLLFLLDDAVTMPYEIRERLLQVDTKLLKAVLDRNTEWVQLTQGLLYYYGNLGVQKLREKIEQYTGQSVDYYKYWYIMNELEQYDHSIQCSAYGFSHYMVDDPKRIDKEHSARPDIDYYSLTKMQVLRAADDEYVERHEGYRQLVSFLHRHWDMDNEEADLIAAELVDQIQRGDSPSELISGLQEELEFTDMNHLQKFMDVLMVFMNKTRLWDLKGYSPEELSAEEKKHLKPLPQHPMQNPPQAPNSAFQENKSSTAVYNFQTMKKIGRNDPCPCGSGKKYKKCCGK